MHLVSQIAGFLNQLYILIKIDKIVWYFACRYKFMEIKSWLKIFLVDKVKNVCYHSGHKTLKLTVSQEWMDEVNRFFACWYKFRTDNLLSHFWLVLTKDEVSEYLLNK